jgi:hypothetical protein
VLFTAIPSSITARIFAVRYRYPGPVDQFDSGKAAGTAAGNVIYPGQGTRPLWQRKRKEILYQFREILEIS